MKTLFETIALKNTRGDQAMKTHKLNQNRSVRITGQIAVLILVLTASGCFKVGGKDSNLLAVDGSASKSEVVSLPPGDLGGNPFANLSSMGTTAVKNFLQIGESMSAVTGVSSSDTTAISGLSIRGFTAANMGSFSLSGRADSVSSAMLKSVATLAGLYCGRSMAIEKTVATAANRKVYKSITFPGTLTSLTPSVITSFSTDLALAFWQRQPSAAEQAALSALITQVLAQTTSSTNTTLSAVQRHDNAILSACVAALSSLDFLKS